MLMFVNISPASYNVGETICSLNFAARCRNVELGQAKKQVGLHSGSGAGNSSSLGGSVGGGSISIAQSSVKAIEDSRTPSKRSSLSGASAPSSGNRGKS